MPTFVEKLQQDAMNPEVRVSDLLRRVKFTAVQLGLGKVEDWVEQELNGYSGVKPPDYRTVHGRPMLITRTVVGKTFAATISIL